MKRDKIIYWISTGIVSAMMILSAFMYLSKNAELIKNFSFLGYPLYFVEMLGIAKLLGAVALIIPFKGKFKEWVYAGFAYTFIGAVWTHIATATPFIAPLVALVILAISYWTRQRLNATN